MIYRFYRSQLSPLQQNAYDMLEKAIQNLRSTVDLPKMTQNQLSKTLDALSYDHPEFFFLYRPGDSSTYIDKKNDNGSYYLHPDHIEYPLRYDYTPDKIRLILKKIESVANKLIARAKAAGCYSDLTIAAFLHDYLTDNISYTKKQRDPKRNHCILGPLINRECVCEGYAKTFLFLLGKAGIPAIYVRGKTDRETDVGHGWNMVKIGKHWYHTDVTWDSNGKGHKGDWDFFMLTSKEISEKKHILPCNVKLPVSNHSLALNRQRHRVS